MQSDSELTPFFKTPFPKQLLTKSLPSSAIQSLEQNDLLIDALLDTSIERQHIPTRTTAINPSTVESIIIAPIIDTRYPDIQIIDENDVVFPMLNGPQRVKSYNQQSKIINFEDPFSIPLQPLSVEPTVIHRSTLKLPPRVRNKVPPTHGHSLLDWQRLIVPPIQLQRYTPSELLLHNTMESCFMAINGKVFDVSQYMFYHPGGNIQVVS